MHYNQPFAVFCFTDTVRIEMETPSYYSVLVTILMVIFSLKTCESITLDDLVVDTNWEPATLPTRRSQEVELFKGKFLFVVLVDSRESERYTV